MSAEWRFCKECLKHVRLYRDLYQRYPFYVPETLKVGAGVLLCVLLARWLYGYLDDFVLDLFVLR